MKKQKIKRAALDDLIWHDGRFIAMCAEVSSAGKCQLTLRVSLLESLQSKRRLIYSFKFNNPTRLTSNFDWQIMKKNHNFGNISEGRIYDGDDFRIFVLLVEGSLEISGKNIDIEVSEESS